ncbi:hypothetical protein HQ81_0191 [Dickeya phage phiDP23.1]|uniref:Uncharacterized protein n=13 Tax=Aglimvirinae TaxID=2169530 RepID=I0J2P2_9CAUD|nr:hypothetical protein G379_gp187 [Dickeya phage vB-DsoM-LIMEstone1]AIM51332.1 hypothetical protein HQ80_0020 [Dickeya phage phiD3]AIM51845.1 hypothetical protein HQ81_0191 [Dickeya phage phiDP23.1]ASD51203.1 hypothetical protein [Dickeya phage JA15]ATW62022.1 hypothetical protein [Dickeya phage PP35]AYN55595.1 hypothetical protein [Dickeya phage Kamild]QHB41519.1 hypothetical protein [Dickeya phage Ds5CZ]QHB41723.1 hypothetical protein [Dickeya phage Ds9CZ]QHB41925.1 hypothetical protein 
MTPLKEMYERLAELQAKEKRFSEEESEIAELNNLIATREKYLQRYINHPPRMVDRVSTIMDLDEVTPGKEIIVREVHQMVAMGQIFGHADQDDMIFLLEKKLVL